jgi:hypothetical protein
MSRVAPITHDTSKSLVQTRVPQPLRIYLKAYGKYHGLKMEGLLVEVLNHFLTLRPDLHGVTWRKPQSNRSIAGVDGGWSQINVLIPDELAGKLAGLAMQLGISRATIAYTALYWFTRYMCPPQEPSQQASGRHNRDEAARSGGHHD